MFVKKVTDAEKSAAKEKITAVFGENTPVEDIPVKEYMLKWLSAFAPDMSVYDAKSFCLPRMMYKNYLWHAFSFEKTDFFSEDDAVEAFGEGFAGGCYILLNHENLLFKVCDGRVINAENIKEFENIIVFREDFSETYVYTGKDTFGPYYKSA